MLIFEKSTEQHLPVELRIHNSNPYFNKVSKDKEEFTAEEILEEIRNDAELGAERYLIRDGEQYVGVIGFLMTNPNDGKTWLGLLVIDQAYQSQGYGARSLQKFYEIMKQRNVESFRIGVVKENEPAHRFWTNQGFQRLEGEKPMEGKIAVIYEKKIPI
jgi:ribosomal protein S18 acetylase RimI-like enzyme